MGGSNSGTFFEGSDTTSGKKAAIHDSDDLNLASLGACELVATTTAIWSFDSLDDGSSISTAILERGCFLTGSLPAGVNLPVVLAGDLHTSGDTVELAF